jgi:Zn-finger nucleic acid-binding protein
MMICPNDKSAMHQVSMPSRYGQKIIIDQCDDCGGLWFDAFELFKVDPGSVENIENANTEALRSLTQIEHKALYCPRDRHQLSQFKDSRFPEDILLMRCAECGGFWLNRGEFTRFQQAREALAKPKHKTVTDKKLEEKVRVIMEGAKAGKNSDALASLAGFLSTPVGERPVIPLAADDPFPEDGNVLRSVIDALALIYRVYIKKEQVS